MGHHVTICVSARSDCLMQFDASWDTQRHDGKWYCCVAIIHHATLLHWPLLQIWFYSISSLVYLQRNIWLMILPPARQSPASLPRQLFLVNSSLKSKGNIFNFSNPRAASRRRRALLLSHFNHFHLANEGLFSPCPEAHLFVLLHFITRLNVNWVFHIICAELMSHSEDFSQISCQGLRRCCNSAIARAEPYFSA